VMAFFVVSVSPLSPGSDGGGHRIDGHFLFPWTERGRRSVVLPAFTVEALRRHQLKQLEAKHKAGPAWQEHDYVFCTSVGTHLNPTYHVLGTLKTLFMLHPTEPDKISLSLADRIDLKC
jgi:hypothetical protein